MKNVAAKNWMLFKTNKKITNQLDECFLIIEIWNNLYIYIFFAFNVWQPSDVIWRQISWPTLVTWWHQAITWTKGDQSSMRSWGIHLRAIPQQMLRIFILDMSLKITNWRLQSHLPGDNELIWFLCFVCLGRLFLKLYWVQEWMS